MFLDVMQIIDLRSYLSEKTKHKVAALFIIFGKLMREHSEKPVTSWI